MKISINLLPPEIIAEQVKNTKFYKIQAAGVIVVLVMIFLTSLTVVLRILQSRNISTVSAKAAQSQQRISDLKDTQAALLLLNDRLKVIEQYWGVASKQSSMYEIINKLTPPTVAINAVTVNNAGEVILLALVLDSASLDNFVTSLTAKESNEDKISQVSVDSLNRGRDGVYRVSLKVKPK